MCCGTSSASGRTARRRRCSMAASSSITRWRCGRCGSGGACGCAPSELSQIVLGFAIPILLARHVVGTRIADNFFHTDVGYYAYLLWVYFVRVARTRLRADAGLGRRLGSRDDRPAFLAEGAALVRAPATGGARRRRARPGPVAARRDRSRVGRLPLSPPTRTGSHAAFAHMTLPSPETQQHPRTDHRRCSVGFSPAWSRRYCWRALARRIWQRRHGLVRIGYPDGRFVEVTPGTSVLEASRLAGIPHASVCGGRGRCSTCRVRVRGEIRSIDPPCRGRAARAAPHRRNAQCPPRLPVAAARRGRGDAAAAAFCACRGRAAPGRFRAGQRARDRDPVRRHPRLHRALRGPAPLRRGVRPQPLFRGDGTRGRSGGRARRQVHRRRRHGAVRHRARRPCRLPRGARRRPADVRAARRAQRFAAGRARSAAAHRHRHPLRAGHRRRDGLWQRRRDHRDRRRRQHREPARKPDQELCLRARRLRGDRVARRARPFRVSAP